MGKYIGYDDKCREVLMCPNPGCDVVEYDHEVIRQRRGILPVPPAPRWQLPH